MRKYSYEIKREHHTATYIVKAASKEEAIKKIEKISGEHNIHVKEI